MTGSRVGNLERTRPLLVSDESAEPGMDAHVRAHREAARTARLLPGLTDEEAHFAVHLKPVHEQVKLATLGAGGAIILFVEARIPAAEFRARLTRVIANFERARAQLVEIEAPPSVAERQQAYLAAIDEARQAVKGLPGRADAAARKRIERSTRRIAASHHRMQELGWTFWQPEYVPSGSEGSPANPHWREQSASA